MTQKFKPIRPGELHTAWHNAWSIGSMEEHGAGDRTVEYIGSLVYGYLDNDQKKGRMVYDYYQDNLGEYWFNTRALLPDGSLVSMDIYLFGRELKRGTQRRHKKSNRK